MKNSFSIYFTQLLVAIFNRHYQNELVSSIRYKLACASIEGSNQPAHLYCLIGVFDGRSVGSQESIVSSGGKIMTVI